MESEAVVWVSPCWTDWYQMGMSSDPVDDSRSARAYAHWHLADELSRRDPESDVTRGAVVLKLWHAVDGRVRLLHDLYALNDLASRLGWGSERLTIIEVLGRLGLVQPLALQDLKKIRNLVEHADRGAPSPADCRRFIELVWYFLRSTDLFASRVVRDFELESGGPYFASFNRPARSWAWTIYGRFPDASVSTTPSDTAMELHLDKPISEVAAGVVSLGGAMVNSPTALRDVVAGYFLLDLPDHRPR